MEGTVLLLKDRRIFAVFALMLATFLVSLDMMIMDTAIPRIVGSLGGFSMLTWLITSYMLTSTVTIPIYGKLSDMIGRKIIFTVGAVIFVVGSALCGLAQSMGQLILFRALQGLGAGAILPTVQTLIGDIFTPAERARFQAWFSGVWGFSALIGPLVGGLFVDFLNWRWIFYINIPSGAIALYMVWRHLDERVVRKPAKIDYFGALTLTVGVTALMILLMLGGTEYPWGSPTILALGAAALTSLSVFVWHERRAENPIVPFYLFRHRNIGIPVLASFLLGGALVGITVYLPLWIQGVQGYSATLSGASLLWLTIGWPISAWVGGKVALRFGIRPMVLTGTTLVAVAGGTLVWLVYNFNPIPTVAVAGATFFMGWGMGFSMLGHILGLQHAAEWSVRGVATASHAFMRTMGGMVWISAMGGVLNLSLLGRLQGVPGLEVNTAQEAGRLANSLLDPEVWGKMPPEQVALLREVLAGAVRTTLGLIVLAAVLALLVTLALPNIRFSKDAAPAKPAPQPQPDPVKT